MLVRRIAGHLRRQDWTAFGIEFLIVVIGIYAAFELDRWRELEAERRAYENYIQSLNLELEEMIPEARNRIGEMEATEEQHNSVIQWLNSDRPPSQFTQDMCFATFRSLVLNWSAARLETAELLVAAGWTPSVQDTELRRLLLALRSLQERTAGAVDRFVLQIVNVSDRYPELLRRADRSVEEIRDGLVCDALGMRASQAFKNQLFGNIGRRSALLDSRRSELELLEKIAARVNQLRG